jgi:hypothetical protein
MYEKSFLTGGEGKDISGDGVAHLTKEDGYEAAQQGAHCRKKL